LTEFEYPEHGPDSIDEDIESLLKLQANYGNAYGFSVEKLVDKLKRHIDTKNKLKQSELVWVNGIWDYKASNLIYSDVSPVLIDPDYSGFLPRVLDLALAVVLFHNYELRSAPSRVFTGNEFDLFFKGYGEFVTLSDTEKSLWEDALNFMLLEEGVWLILESFEDAARLEKEDFIISLMNFDPGCYQL
jgi:spectinomycin phosphotransferase